MNQGNLSWWWKGKQLVWNSPSLVSTQPAQGVGAKGRPKESTEGSPGAELVEGTRAVGQGRKVGAVQGSGLGQGALGKRQFECCGELE